MKKEIRIGLLLGRFQPLHPGHLRLIGEIIKENDKLIVCIGSTQKSKTLSAKEQKKNLKKQMNLLYPGKEISIFTMADPHPKSLWPEKLKSACKIDKPSQVTFYRADKMSPACLSKLKSLGFKVKRVKRKPFYYCAPDNQYRLVSSSSEIRELHAKSRSPLK